MASLRQFALERQSRGHAREAQVPQGRRARYPPRDRGGHPAGIGRAARVAAELIHSGGLLQRRDQGRQPAARCPGHRRSPGRADSRCHAFRRSKPASRRSQGSRPNGYPPVQRARGIRGGGERRGAPGLRRRRFADTLVHVRCPAGADLTGSLGNSLTVEDLRTSQFTRNELLASRLGQCPVGDVPGSGGRQHFIERRGEGIGVIEDETVALAGSKPVFEPVGEREFKVTLPAASPPLPDGLATRVAVRQAETGRPLRDVHVVVLYPNKTYLETRTDAFGHADFELYAELPLTVLCAAPGLRAHVERGHRGGEGLDVEMRTADNGGSMIIAHRTGHLPGINGRLNPKLDRLDRSYLYADNVAIDDGRQQPVYFALNKPVRLTDSLGARATLWFREMLGSSFVFDYRYE
ncbi:MAG: hypothetical protein F4087_01615 [Gemmatimonadetes bacterium]|nr:hypothetical protein [Gemmatimonadota bacterium]MYA13002.1 hypothetical protein [Gemmatimonadota bacterium]MYD14713.1 hypothetical protein [Gemmatimonadota bacterium]MYE69676.1 hypothetical protein [Gemmatimonadota bacterium]MYJ67196.1 hypothetical protein [Gemmatimonadota bacterium]